MRSTVMGVDAERRLPAASLRETLKVYLPSLTAAPDAFRPFHVVDQVERDVIVQERTSVVPL